MFFNFHRFFGFGAQLKLDNLLKQDNLTLETIFNEEEILQELKGTNSAKFADYLITNPLEYRKMIQFVVDEIPDQVNDRNRCIKFPFYTSEILGAENEKLISFLFEKPEEQVQEDIKNPLMDQDTEQAEVQEQIDLTKENEVIRANLLNDLLRLLENDAIIVTTAGYFSKIVNAIIHKKGHQFWEHLKHNPDIISNMFKHSYLRHIVDIFEKLISLDENQEQHTEYIPERQALLKRLVLYLKGKSHSSVIVQNISEIFIELYKKATNQYETISQDYKELLVQFTLITGTPALFMELATQTQQGIVYGVINSQLEYLNKHFDSQFSQDFEIIRYYKPVLGLCQRGLQQTDSFRSSFISADGTEITPLGDGKLQILQLIVSLLHKPDLYSFFDSNLLNQIIDLVKQYPSNNQLHILFEKIIVSIIDSQDENLQRNLFEDTNVLLFIIQSNDSSARTNKYGYQGILTKISNYITQNQDASAPLKQALEFLSDIKVDWNEYMKELDAVNKIEQEWILGVNPKSTNKILNEIISPPIQRPQQSSQQPLFLGPQVIRKCTSSENNDVIKPSDDDGDVAEIEEDIQQDEEIVHQDHQEQQQQPEVNQEEQVQVVQAQEEVIVTQNYQQEEQQSNEQVVEQKEEKAPVIEEEAPVIEEEIQFEDSQGSKQDNSNEQSIEEILKQVHEDDVIKTQQAPDMQNVESTEQPQEQQVQTEQVEQQEESTEQTNENQTVEQAAEKQEEVEQKNQEVEEKQVDEKVEEQNVQPAIEEPVSDQTVTQVATEEQVQQQEEQPQLES